jgi:hypothetical protein
VDCSDSLRSVGRTLRSLLSSENSDYIDLLKQGEMPDRILTGDVGRLQAIESYLSLSCCSTIKPVRLP